MFSRDVLYSIFYYLDVEDLKRITTVCKQWNTIINSTPIILQKFPLYPPELETGLMIE